MKLTLLFSLLFFLTNFKNQRKTEPKPPNILLILVDDMGYGDLACQGATDMRTPNIDNLAKSGLTLRNFYANSTVCSPSRAALLSGRYPDMVGVPGVIRQFEDNSWGHLSKNAVLIPQVLKSKGYQTGMIGKWHLGFDSPNIPNDKGFDFFKGFLADMMDDYWTHLRGGVNWMRHNKTVIDPKGHATDIFTDWTLDYLYEKKGDSKPFFLYLAYNAPHFPIQPPQEFLEKVSKREPKISEKRAKNVALIEHLDFNIGRIMDVLKETRLEENTLVIFTSDNGGALSYAQSNGQLRGGKQDMYEGGIRVPAFFYWKNKIKAGSRSGNFAMLMDIFPTICDLTNTAKSNLVDGISILPTLLGKQQTTNERYTFWMRREGGDKYGGQAYYAARHQDDKILQNTPFEAIQFFNLQTDEKESKALDQEKSDIYKNLRIQLQEHIRKAGSVPWQKEE